MVGKTGGFFFLTPPWGVPPPEMDFWAHLKGALSGMVRGIFWGGRFPGDFSPRKGSGYKGPPRSVKFGGGAFGERAPP